ncbi:hypothetical protein BDZ91DRAFT_786250 [Kalaharituber pfeilii]|nr:hypothetical protein BDZ91DRAFT_786250 [Kalaharituber pfeilii]
MPLPCLGVSGVVAAQAREGAQILIRYGAWISRSWSDTVIWLVWEYSTVQQGRVVGPTCVLGQFTSSPLSAWAKRMRQQPVRIKGIVVQVMIALRSLQRCFNTLTFSVSSPDEVAIAVSNSNQILTLDLPILSRLCLSMSCSESHTLKLRFAGKAAGQSWTAA